MTSDLMVLTQPVCRSSSRADIPAILDIARQIWNGQDYVPVLLEGWLADSTGWMFTAELSAKPVGIVKLSLLGEDQWWMEGLRVDPSVYNRGIGKHLFHYALDFWRSHLNGTLQLLTGEKNATSQHLADLFGFGLQEKLRLYTAHPVTGAPSVLKPARLNDLHRFTQKSSSLENPFSLSPYLDSGWAFNSIDLSTITSAIQSGQLWMAKDSPDWIILHENPVGKPKQGILQAIRNSPGRLEWLLVQASKLTHHLGWENLHWMVPEIGWDAITQLNVGFQPNPSDCLRIYRYQPAI